MINNNLIDNVINNADNILECCNHLKVLLQAFESNVVSKDFIDFSEYYNYKVVDEQIKLINSISAYYDNLKYII